MRPRLEIEVSSFTAGHHCCMDRNDCRDSILGACSICVAFVQSTVAASSDCSVGKNERKVLATVMKEISTHSHSALVVESSTDSSHFAQTFTLRDLLSRDGNVGITSTAKCGSER